MRNQQYNSQPSTYFKIATRSIPSGGGATLTATGPKRAVARGRKASLRFTLASPAVNMTKAVHTPKRELAAKYNTTYYSVRLAVPAGATVLRASTPLGAGKGNKAVINATGVFWPRVPLKEGGPRARKINVKVTAKVVKTATGPLLFNATATNLATGSTITAEPTPLAVRAQREQGCMGVRLGRCFCLTWCPPYTCPRNEPTGGAQVSRPRGDWCRHSSSWWHLRLG
jgi:hypothetical protein